MSALWERDGSKSPELEPAYSRCDEMGAQFWEWQVANIVAFIDLTYPELSEVIEAACGSKEALAKAARDRKLTEE